MGSSDPVRSPIGKYLTGRVYSRSQSNANGRDRDRSPAVRLALPGGNMARKLQIGALILGMVLVAAERFTANASQLDPSDRMLSESVPFPPPN
jgi:hypothetical protein